MSSTIMQNEVNRSNMGFSASIQHLIQNLSSQSQLTPELLRKLVLQANIQPADLTPWIDYEHPITDSYGRKLVYDGGHFEIMVMSWNVGDFSAIHDHGYTQWGAVQIFGNATHITYALENNILTTKEIIAVQPHQVLAVNHDLIHQMGNPSDETFLSLHVYGCNDRHGEITSDARIFDLWENSIQYTNGGVFFCLPESQISQRQSGLVGDTLTTLRHHQQMLARIEMILANSNKYADQWQQKAKHIKNKIKELRIINDLN